jgi:uncharacterized protein YndB with AHSA1/START domain/translation elongation factor EF-1beta
MSDTKNLEVRVEKMIQKSANEVFRALSEGRLFMNCGADSGSMQLDFKVGGKYRICFKQYELTNTGEFLEIVPDKKIVFTWCSSFEEPRTPDTRVTIELFPDGNKTRLLLVHTGFKSEDSRSKHEGGWKAGLTDLTKEVQEAQLRIVRVFEVPVAKLYEVCRERLVKGEVLKSDSGKKIVFGLQSTQVTLNFDEEDDGGSSVEIIHERLNTDALIQSHRLNWETVTAALQKELKPS